MKEGIPPEEKLLRLIKNQNKQGNIFPDKKTVIKDIASAPAVQISFSNLLKKYFPFLTTQRIIAAVFVVSCFYLAASFIYPLFSKKERFLEIAPEVKSELTKEPLQEAKPYEFYLQGVKGKKVFSTTTAVEKERPSVSASTAESSKGFNLIGIISGENPQAIIEDKASGKTYYLNEGQFIGEFCAEDIQEDKVILDRNGQKLELFL